MKFCMVLEDESLRPLGSNLIINKNPDEFYKILNQSFFIEREFVETRARFKQIIPYCVGVWQDTKEYKNYILTYKRKPKHTEQRLAEKWSIGFGGHIEPGDTKNTSRLENTQGMMTLFNCAEREFEEEVGLSFRLPYILGFLNLDEPGPVERVHFGVIFRVNMNSTLVDEKPPLPKPKDDEVDRFRWEILDDSNNLIEKRNWEAWSKVILENWKQVFSV